jgi:hypothetical protein
MLFARVAVESIEAIDFRFHCKLIHEYSASIKARSLGLNTALASI